MEAFSWQADKSLIETLKVQPYFFDFDQLVTLIAHYTQKSDVPYESKQACAQNLAQIELKSFVSYAAQASAIHHIDWQTLQKPKVWIHFISLAGAQGPLPVEYTELIMEQARHKQTIFADYLDVFNQQLAGVLYKLHYKTKPSLQSLPLALSSTGQILNCLINGTALVDRHLPLQPYAAHFYKRNKSVKALEQILSHYGQMPVVVKDFVARHEVISSDDLTKIGNTLGQSHSLGQSATLGRRMCIENGAIEIHLFPKNIHTYYSLVEEKIKWSHSKYKNINTHEIKNSLFYNIYHLAKSYCPKHYAISVRIHNVKSPLKSFPVNAKAQVVGANRLSYTTQLTAKR